MKTKITATLFSLLIGILFFALVNRGGSSKHNGASQGKTGTTAPQTAGEQQTKPPSVSVIHVSYLPLNLALISGGFTSVEEFQQRVAKDPTLSSFFGSCDVQPTMQALPDDILVFMAFRRGQEIKWTRRPLLVHKGEWVLTFCGKTVLARCGNLISWTPMQPSEDLPPSLLEMPVEDLRPSEELAFSAPADPAPGAVGGLGLAALPASGSHRSFPLIPPFYIPSNSSSGRAPAAPPSLALESDEFSGHEALYTLLLGFFAIALMKLFTR
jgi:hypothetical protein